MTNVIKIKNLITGEGVEEITISDDYTWFWDIKWSPINNVLLYATVLDGNYTFKTISRDDKKENKLFTEKSDISKLIWSPKGDAFYYLVRNELQSDLKKININKNTGIIEGSPMTLI